MSSTGPASNHLFAFHVKVRRGPDCEMPLNLIGAFVTCYVAAADYQAGLIRAVEELKSKGYIFEDLVDGKVHQLDPLHWDEYMASTWPECVDYFPPQRDLARFITAGGVFFGPFCGYES